MQLNVRASYLGYKRLSMPIGGGRAIRGVRAAAQAPEWTVGQPMASNAFLAVDSGACRSPGRCCTYMPPLNVFFTQSPIMDARWRARRSWRWCCSRGRCCTSRPSGGTTCGASPLASPSASGGASR
eukprot:1176342-Prorocentrum_minimum.AAC.1